MNMTYKPPFLFKNPHISTICTAIFRDVKDVKYNRERMETNDGDFIDLDWSMANSENKNLVVLSHGLEGSSQSGYIKGMIKFFNDNDVNAVAWNCRSCSGEMNRTKRYYHSGASDDLTEVLSYIINNYENFNSLHLIGFSMGGNIILKYLGENHTSISNKIKSAVTFSVPVELKESSKLLARGFRKIYTKNFLKTLKVKAIQKKELLSDLDFTSLDKTKTLSDFDNIFTAPLHGFSDSDDYYKKSSSRQFLKYINIPTLIINALDDPFLAEDCYPQNESKNNNYLSLETPRYGGHVGFCENWKQSKYWSEQKAWSFISTYL